MVNVLEEVLKILNREKTQMRPTATSSKIIPSEDTKLNNVFEILEIKDANLSSHEDDQEEEAGNDRDSSDKENAMVRKPPKTKKKKQTGRGKKTARSKETETQFAIIQNPVTALDISSPAKEYEITAEKKTNYIS